MIDAIREEYERLSELDADGGYVHAGIEGFCEAMELLGKIMDKKHIELIHSMGPYTLEDRIRTYLWNRFGQYQGTDEGKATEHYNIMGAPEVILELFHNHLAQEALVNLKPELQRDKLQEWQACYAALFNQINPVMEENKRLKAEFANVLLKRLEE